MIKFEIGVSNNCECGESVEETLNNIKAAGFSSVMVAQGKTPFESSIKYALSIGLKIPFVHLASRRASDIWAIGESCNRQINLLKEGIDICKRYGIKIAVLHPTTGSASDIALPPNQHGLEKIKEIIEYAKQAGVKIALENLDESNFCSFKYVMEEIKDKNLGFCYDCGHHNLYYPKRDLFKLYGNRLLAVHIHDNLMDWKYGMDYTRDLHWLPFDGKINFEKICKELVASEYGDCIMLELHRIGPDTLKKYDNVPPIEYLTEARKRAEKLVEMLECFASNN